jgi:hypothetical protein
MIAHLQRQLVEKITPTHVVDCGGIDICKHRYIPILLNG